MVLRQPYSFLFLLFLALPDIAASQPLKHVHHTSYNVNEGLLHSQVIDMAEDGNGFLWLSTGSGVQRFDGKDFLQITANEKNNGLPDDKHVLFFPLKNGNIWFRHSKGVSEYNIQYDRFHTITQLNKSNSSMAPYPLLEEGNGIWCHYGGDSLFLFDKEKNKFTDKIFFPANHSPVTIRSTRNQKGEIVFTGCTEKNIFISVTKKGISHSFVAGKLQGKFAMIENYKPDTLLVATQRGIEKMDIQTGHFVFVCPYKNTPPGLATPVNIKLHKLNDGYLVAEGKEMYELNLQQGRYTYRLVNLQNEDIINFGFIYNIFTDSRNNTWILSESSGLYKINSGLSGFKYYGTGDKEKNFTKIICVDKNENRVLCGTSEKGLLIFDTLQQLIKTIDRFPREVGQQTIAAIQKTAPHRYLIFIMGGMKVYLLNSLNFSFQSVQVDTSLARLINVFDYHMTVYSTSDTDGVIQNSYNIYKFTWHPPSSLRITSLTDIPTASVGSYLDSQHRLWVGGLLKYLSFNVNTGSFRSFDLPEKIIARCFYTSGNNTIWMGTEKGLYLLDSLGKIIKKFYKTDGLVNENIYALRGDKQGNLWISHNKGLSCMTPSGSFVHFNKYDGLQENEFNTNSVFATNDGELFFGGVNGVSSFYPEIILQHIEQPRLFITSIKIKDEEWHTDTAVWNVSHINLPHSKNNLSFEFTAIGQHQPDQYNYQFRMMGADESWINGSNQGKARYVLTPGKYVFELYAGNSFSKDSLPLKQIWITIRPPFWQTTWFITALIISLIIFTVLITRYLARIKLNRRIAQLEKKKALDEERLRISREMHDDIGAGLTQITMLSESAKNKDRNEEQLSKIANTSRKLVNDMSEIIWSMNPEQNSLDQFAAYLREQLHQLLEYSGIEYKLDFPENGSNVLLNNSQKRNLLLVTKEIVHNAIKHSKAKHISVVANQEGQSLEFSITDDGNGFDPFHATSGNGLRNIKKRIEELEGKLQIESHPKEGSVFHYKIPLTSA